MQMGDLEALADGFLRRSGLTGLQPPSRIAKACGVVVEAVANQRAEGTLGRLRSQWVIGVRASLPYARRQHRVGHEIGHILLVEAGVPTGPYTEAWCDFIGGALVLPRDQVRAVAALGALSEAAERIRTTETLVALRIGEVTGEPVAVVTPHTVYARGDVEWPDKGTLRRWSRSGRVGLRKWRLRDDPKRVVMTSDGEGGDE